MLRSSVSKTVTRSLKTLRLTTIRNLRTSTIILNAQPFLMPSLSPTMEQGNIVSWQFKPGDSFSAGDVLLQIETDKAQMDVEAQDDGKLAKIILEDGTKDVKVGETIAFIADPEDDLASLKIPEVVVPTATKQSPAPPPAAEPGQKTPSEEKSVASTEVAKNKDTKIQQSANRDQTLLPSVQVLLGENGISKEDALAKIPATGPNGRLLKGDVLAYLGQVSNEAVVKIAEYVAGSENLDLSNIQLMKQTTETAEPKLAAQPEKGSSSSSPSSKETAEAAAKPEKVGPTVISKEIYVTVGQSVPYERLEASIDSLIKDAFYYTHKMPINTEIQSDYFDPVFEDLLVVEPYAPRFEYTYELVPVGLAAIGNGTACSMNGAGCGMRTQNGCNMHGQGGCSMHGQAGCSTHGQGNCNMHGQAGCSMHGQGSCNMHGRGSCNIHGQAGCSMHGQGNCNMHGQGCCGQHGQAGCNMHGQNGCRHHNHRGAANRARGYILNLDIKLNDRFADAEAKAERFVDCLEQLELP